MREDREPIVMRPAKSNAAHSMTFWWVWRHLLMPRGVHITEAEITDDSLEDWLYHFQRSEKLARANNPDDGVR